MIAKKAWGEPMDKWFQYSKERYPVIIYLILSLGFALSSNYMFLDNFSLLPFVLSLFGTLLFFFELRLMDELKDYDKDKIANPDRPLPRGLLTPKQVEKAIKNILLGMFGFAFFLSLSLNVYAGICYSLLTMYLFLMYKEFFISKWLNDKILIYATSHQLILILLCIFTVSCFSPNLAVSGKCFHYGFLVLFSFFSYEVCRKLNPNSHPVLKTYLNIFGIKKTFGLVLILSLGSITIHMLRIYPSSIILISSSLCLILSTGILLFNKNLYKLTEVVASISLLLYIWSGVLNYVLA